MSHTKTFAAIEKLKEVELELHRLKNALEMMNKAHDVKREWVELTHEEIEDVMQYIWDDGGLISKDGVKNIEAKLKERNT